MVQKIVGAGYVIEQGTYLLFLLLDECICVHNAACLVNNTSCVACRMVKLSNCLQHKEYAAGDEQRADKHAQSYFLVEEDKRQENGDDDAKFVDGRNT